MRKFTKHPSKVTTATDILSFKCPSCKNKTLYSAEQDVHKVADVDEDELFICDECGGEFRAHPQYDGSIRFTESIESDTSVDDKKIDRRLSSTSKRYKGYRISLDTRHECYNIYDAQGELEDHGFKSVEDAMAHIDELVSIESATDVDEIPEFNDWLYDKLGYGDSDLSDDDWEYYHDKYLKETGQEKYMSGNVYSSKQPGVRRKSTHRPVTAAKKRTTRQGEFDDRRVRNKVDSSTDIDLSEYDYSGNVDGYFVYRKVVTQPDGSKKGMWVAQDQDEKNPPFSITYDQARGFDPINDTSGTKKLAKWLGKRLLPNSVEASKDVKATTYPQGTYWMAKYKDMNGNLHKIVFHFDSQDFDEAEEEMDAVIPEPYTAGRLLGRCDPELAEKDGFVVLSSQDIPCAEEIEDYEDDIQEISQEFTSENTSINSGKLPAIFKLIHLAPGTINIDYGGGKFDNVAEYLAPMDVINLVYDPYNRTPEHNREVIRTVKKAGGADSATCSNVLNVIKEPEVRRNVLENIRRLVKPEGVVYITVYEGSGRGNEGPTKSGYQLNRKTADYLAEIQEVFPDAMRKGKLIIAHPNGSVTTSVECATDVSKKDLMFLAKAAADVTKAEDLEGVISSLLSVDKELYTKYSEEARSDKSPAAIGKDISDELYWRAQGDKVTAADYGGAYDIADDEYFSKDELMEFAYSLEPIIQHLADDEGFGSIVEVSDVYLNDNKLGVAFMIDGAEHSGEVRIDKRRVKWVNDLYKYVTPLFEQIADSFWDYVRPEATGDQRSKWMDIWKNIHIPSYLSELTSSTKTKGQTVEAALVETPQEVVDSLIRILDQYGFTLDPAFETNPGKTWMGAVHLQVINETSHVPAGDFTALRDNVPKALIDAIHDLEDSSNCPITWSFGVNKNGQVTAGLDIMEQYIEDTETIMSATSISMKAIHDKILNAASKRMQKSDMGFPLSEIADYLIVEEEETEDGALKIEVRCELDYNGMRKLAEVLDPIVARYDKNAYFDMVAPGIMEAFIFNKKVTADTAAPIDASVYDFPELPLEPPDYDDPEENESVEYITIDLDDDIIVEVDTVDFVGSPKFEKDEADWVVDEYPSIQLDYSESVAENVLDLLLPQLPAEPGTYRVRGRIHLAYDVMVPVYYESYGPDDEEYIVDDDNVEIDFNYKKSSIENIEVGKD